MLSYHPIATEITVKHIAIAVSASIFIHFSTLQIFNLSDVNFHYAAQEPGTKIIIGSNNYTDAYDLQSIATELIAETILATDNQLQLHQVGAINSLDDLTATNSAINSPQLNSNPSESSIMAAEGINLSDSELILAPTTTIATIQIKQITAATTPKLPTLENMKVVKIKNIIPITKKSLATKTKAINYQKIKFAITIKTESALEIVPEANTKNNLLLGINQKFKKKMTSQLSIGLNKIKPTIKARKLQGDTYVQFTIDRNGKLIDSKIVSSTNNKLARLILKMVRANSPYQPLPKKYLGDSLKFSYPINIKIK